MTLPEQRPDVRTCVCCRVRFRVTPMAVREYNAIHITPTAVHALEIAALYFDRESDERFTAIEFIHWLKPDVPGTPEHRARQRLFAHGPEDTASEERRRMYDRERQRARYHEDPEYRKRQLEANRRWRAKRRAA